MLAASRAARARDANLRTESMAASRRGFLFPVSSGNSERWTDVPANRRWSASLRNGAAGASARDTVTNAWWRVATAAGSASASGAQNRGRLTRTYQFERSASQKSMMARTPPVGSYPDHAERTAATVASSRLNSHWSIRSSCFGGLAAGFQSPAYCAKNSYELRSWLRNPETTFGIASGSNRLGRPTWLEAIRYTRTASAPKRWIITHGSTRLPRRLDILRPSAPSRRPLTITWRYDASSVTPAAIASSE